MVLKIGQRAVAENSEEAVRMIARNRKARFEYEILDAYEAGLELEGSEVKSLRSGEVSIEEAFVHPSGGELFVYNMHIAPYSHTGWTPPDSRRRRKLLLHKRQVRSIIARLDRRGATCVLLRLYFRRGWAKVEIALVKHRSQHDKRRKIKERETKREVERYLKRRLR